MKGLQRSVRPVVWVGLTAVTAWVSASSDRAFRLDGPASRVVIRKDVVYRVHDGQRLALDVYIPPVAVPSPVPGPRRPAILAVHGGSWIGGSRRLFRPGPLNPSPVAVRLAESGFVVIAADYRLARPGSPSWPDALEDLRAALRWIHRNADDLGVDAERIAVLGQSAGAHLAALLGTTGSLVDTPDGLPRVWAVIDFYGPSDLDRLARERQLPHEPVYVFLGVEPGFTSDATRPASPFYRIHRGAAPMLIIHGSLDPWVPIGQSEALAEVLEQAGVRHRLIRVEGARHGFDARVNDPEVTDPRHRDLLPAIVAFLRELPAGPAR